MYTTLVDILHAGVGFAWLDFIYLFFSFVCLLEGCSFGWLWDASAKLGRFLLRKLSILLSWWDSTFGLITGVLKHVRWQCAVGGVTAHCWVSSALFGTFFSHFVVLLLWVKMMARDDRTWLRVGRDTFLPSLPRNEPMLVRNVRSYNTFFQTTSESGR